MFVAICSFSQGHIDPHGLAHFTINVLIDTRYRVEGFRLGD